MHSAFRSGAFLDQDQLTAIVSWLFVLEDGDSADIAVVGNEGVVGISLFMGGGITPSRAVAQRAGQGLRLSSHAIREAFSRIGPVMHLMLRYTQALLTLMAQTVACNRPSHAGQAAGSLAADDHGSAERQ